MSRLFRDGLLLGALSAALLLLVAAVTAGFVG